MGGIVDMSSQNFGWILGSVLFVAAFPKGSEVLLPVPIPHILM